MKFTGLELDRTAHRVSVILASTVVTLVSAAPASAGTLDQQQTDTSGFALAIGTNCVDTCLEFSQAQTFTAGLSGGLDQVDLFLRRNPATTAPLTGEIRTVASDGCPSAKVLASTQLAATDVPASTAQFVPAAFAEPTPVTAGTQYAIVLYTVSGNTYGTAASTANPYPAGQFCSAPAPPTTWSGHGGDDLAFKTYVDTAADSEPPSPPGLEPSTCKGEPATIIAQTDQPVIGTPGIDVIVGTAGSDGIDAGHGNDVVCAKGGADRVKGGPGKDDLNGGQDDDRLKGQGGDDRMRGQGDADRLRGGGGPDDLGGGHGFDRCRSGVLRTCER